jgi:hypothetical protein
MENPREERCCHPNREGAFQWCSRVGVRSPNWEQTSPFDLGGFDVVCLDLLLTPVCSESLSGCRRVLSKQPRLAPKGRLP